MQIYDSWPVRMIIFILTDKTIKIMMTSHLLGLCLTHFFLRLKNKICSPDLQRMNRNCSFFQIGYFTWQYCNFDKIPTNCVPLVRSKTELKGQKILKKLCFYIMKGRSQCQTDFIDFHKCMSWSWKLLDPFSAANWAWLGLVGEWRVPGHRQGPFNLSHYEIGRLMRRIINREHSGKKGQK